MSKKLVIEIVGDSSSLDRAFRKAGSSSSALGGHLRTLGKAAAVAGVALGGAVVVGAVKAINAASNLDEQINKTRVVFGKSGGEIEDWSKGLSKSFGLSQRAALEAAGTYGNMLVPMGFSRVEAGKMSKKFVELAADMASFNNASPEETLDALRAGLAGETEPLRRFGVFLNDARIKSEAASQGFKLVKGQLDPMAKAAATAAIIMKDTADTQGDFGRTSESLANQQRILKAELENSAAAIGTALLPAAVALMGLLSQIIPVVTDFGIRMAEAVGPVLVAAIANIAPMFERVKQAVLDLSVEVQHLWTALQPILGATFSAAMSTFGQSTIGATIAMIGAHAALVRVAQALAAVRAAATGAALASLLSPIGLITAAVGLMTFAFLASRNASNQLGDSLNRQRNALKALQDAADQSVSSQDRLRDAQIAVKQAVLNVSAALRQRNQLEVDGKRGTDEFKQAQVNVQSAYANRIRAEHELSAAQKGNTESTGRQQAAIRHLGEDAEALRGRMERTTGALQKMGAETEKHQVVGLYAREMQKMATQADKVAVATAKSNPKVAEAAAHFAEAARQAAAYAKRTGEIPPALAAVIGPASTAGKNVGSSFGAGIAAGIGSQIGAISAAAAASVRAAEQAARAEAQAKSPSLLFALLGRDLGEGLRQGFQEKYLDLSKAGREGVGKMIDAMTQRVTDAKGAFATAFDALVSNALSAFDKLTSEFETKTERLIRKQDEARASAERQGALTSAREQLATATNPEEIKAAEQAIADAQFAIQRAADERRAANERKQYEASRERQRVNFEQQLATLQQAFLKQEITTEQFHTKLIALFKKFEVPFGKAAQRLGASLAHGLREAFDDVHKAARALAQEVLAAFEGITIRIKTELQHTDSPGRQHGGPVRRGSSYVVGEAGPELFVPNTSGRIVPNGATGTLAGGVTVIINGDVTGDEIVERVRQGLLRINQFNPGNPVAR